MNSEEKKDDISLDDVISILLNGKKIIILTTLASIFISLVVALSMSNYYKSTAILTINNNSSNQSFGLSPGISNLASIAGISLPNSASDDKASLVIQTIMTRDFFNHLLSKRDVLPELLATESYDGTTGKIIYNDSIYDPETKTWTWDGPSGKDKKPSLLYAHTIYLEEILSIDKDRETTFISISVEHLSPIFAKDFLTIIINEANDLMRERDLNEATNALNYLENELGKTALIEMKNSINSIIQSQLETKMIANIRDDYLLRTIEPPFIPEQKSKPSRSLILILGTILGFIISIFYLLIQHFRASYSSSNYERP